jgi:hypothetical protein
MGMIAEAAEAVEAVVAVAAVVAVVAVAVEAEAAEAQTGTDLETETESAETTESAWLLLLLPERRSQPLCPLSALPPPLPPPPPLAATPKECLSPSTDSWRTLRIGSSPAGELIYTICNMYQNNIHNYTQLYTIILHIHTNDAYIHTHQ